jgi:PAS domain S-box-containing protein
VRYSTILETSEAATVSIEENMVVSLVNARFETLNGYSKDEVEGKLPWTIGILPEDLSRMRACHIQRRTQPAAAPSRYEFRIRDKNGDVKNIYASVALIPGTQKSVASLMDITDLKKTGRDLHKLSLAVQAPPTGSS